MRYYLTLILAVLLFPQLVFAGDFLIATGSKSGTYYALVSQLAQRCSNEQTQIVPVETDGSVDNLMKLLNNDVEAALIQSDVLMLKGLNDANLKNQVKTLMAFHQEEVHVPALAVSKVKEGGYGFGAFKVGQKGVVLNSFEDLAGKKVGAAGGSIKTAQLIQLRTSIPFELVEFKTGDEVKNALLSGDIAAGIFVGGQPLGAISALDANWKLLPFNQISIERLKDYYGAARVQYPKMSPNSFPTIATDAILVTGNYRSPQKVAALKALVDCIRENLIDFQETRGFHAKWRAIDPANNGKWDAKYEFPAVKPAKLKKK